jgi:superfamily II DNA helicase RecQ
MLYDLSFDQTEASRYITVIFVPLSALGQGQAEYINQKANKSVAIFYNKTKTGDEYLEDIRRGKYLWVFMSPERVLHTQTMKIFWEDASFHAKVLLLAVDESHLVSDWLVFVFLLLCRIVLLRTVPQSI